MSGNCYIYSNDITNIAWAFRRVREEGDNRIFPRLNIYFHANTTTNNTILGPASQNNSTSIVGQILTFNLEDDGSYSIWSNLYFYPVASVAAARAANGD
jgi:hypothetical protein